MKPLDLDELKERIRLHELWLASGNQSGSQLVLTDAVIEGAELGGRKLARSIIAGVEWRASDLSGCNMGASTLSRVVFRDCDLTRSELDDCKMTDVQMEGSRFPGALFAGATVDGMSVTRCDFAGVNFAKSLLKRARLNELSLRLANMLKMVAEDVEMQNCDLSQVNALKAHFYRVDLRGSILDGADLTHSLFKSSRLGRCRGTPASVGDLRLMDVDFSDDGSGAQMVRDGTSADLQKFLSR
jgi:uncharacterized protein YjbI with pentapeptide repeats